ncbi:hypothetical protein [Bythopirellula polymerisocia]|uniref:ABC-2 family transporter protein n=1 Tax=Bythopirellula polymerisocia TaxID=2528003 RepID=A0A5C6CHS4_9BACT|nr:hypothetical protein [Bythopirellula polymerisocia]TWU23585.1 hypothetical protein Pla144_37600 [Bythopirellula polymerisocia]
MLKALAIKELRESLGIVALAALGLGYVFLDLIGVAMMPWTYAGQTYFPFSAGAQVFSQALCLGAFALLLGFRQTAWELHNGTFYFMLHRPLPRRIVIIVKLMVGTILVLLLNALFVGIYGWWAATPGTQPTPFFWSMTLPAWKLGLAIIPVYLGAFLSGMRPGQWFGSRLAPALTGIAAGYAVYVMPWWWLSSIIWVASVVFFTVSIFYYSSERDY